MATKMGYAPGVRIQLKDNSAYTVVENPNTVAGIVGYASKGELNKIIPVANTGELGVKLGYGYQSYKYNQGMYAANAVLTTGGEVEFVRPYGEEISRTDAYKRDLKTDTFVVAFDKNAALYDNNCAKDKKTGEQLPSTSFNVKHYASTRFKTDGAAEFGVTRKINNIAETIESNNNVQFNVDASENFSDSKESRSYDGEHCTDMVMFAIMNRDPSFAYRAFDRYEVLSATNVPSTTGVFSCLLSTKPVFVVGDKVVVPNTTLKTDSFGNKGTSQVTATATVLEIDDKTVKIQLDDEYLSIYGTGRPNVLIYSDSESAIADGFDYMTLRTAVAGNSVKNFNAVKLGKAVDPQNPAQGRPNVAVKNGSMIDFLDKSGNPFFVRMRSNGSTFGDITGQVAPIEEGAVSMTLTINGANKYILDGDKLNLTRLTDNKTFPFVVGVVDENTVIGKIPDDFVTPSTDPEVPTYPTADVSVAVTITEFVDASDSGVYVADITDATESTYNNWRHVADKIAETIQVNKKFSKVASVNDIVSFDKTDILVDPSASYDYSVGDQVAIVHNTNSDYTKDNAKDTAESSAYEGKIYTITAINSMSGRITVNADKDIDLDASAVEYQLLNMTTTSATVYAADSKYQERVTYTVTEKNVQVVVTPVEATTVNQYSISNSNIVAHAAVDTVITLTKMNDQEPVTVTFVVTGKSEDGSKVIGTLSDTSVEETVTYDTATFDYETDEVFDYADLYMISSYTMYVSKVDQKLPNVDFTSSEFITDASKFEPEVEKSPVVLADSDIGASFLALGLAKTNYVDINFDGNPIQVFALSDEGIDVARMFLAVSYRFNGRLYEFEGTVAPYNHNGRQLSIVEAAEYELQDSGLEFVINESGVLDYFLENNSYDLSQTIQNGVLNGSYTAISYNPDDPAIMNDAVWTYDPQNNNSGSTLSTVWNLFVNKDASDVDMLVAAGVAINSPFTKKNETLNTQVMQAMINVCENRKDCFCVFDGVYEPDINKAVKKMISAGQVSLGRWGFLYDGRGVFQDSLYTQSQVECMKSVQLAAIITANRQSGIFWLPPAGDEAYIPAAWGTKERFTRTYSSEDKNCDHAKLSDIHVNATRVNKDGLRIWGDFTLQMEDTAFNQVHVTMLVAGIHKMFYKYLDHKVFKLNTTILRAQITSDLQDKLNAIMRQNPPGLINGKVVCDDTNNTPEIIDQNFLIVDLKLLPPKSTRWIILRTSVESTKNGKNISTEIMSK